MTMRLAPGFNVWMAAPSLLQMVAPPAPVTALITTAVGVAGLLAAAKLGCMGMANRVMSPAVASKSRKFTGCSVGVTTHAYNFFL